MKKYLSVLLGIVIISFSACRKDCNKLENNSSDKLSIVGAIVVKTGTVNFTNKNTTGLATIYQQKKGTFILAFEQMQFSSATDVDVKLAKANNTSDVTIKLFSVKNITDHLYFEIPSSIDVNSFNYLFFQSDVSDAPVGDVIFK